MSQKPIQISRIAAKRHSADMTGKTIVINGATAGIGKETARSLAKMGGNIIIAARNQDKAQSTIEAIRKDLDSDTVKGRPGPVLQGAAKKIRSEQYPLYLCEPASWGGAYEDPRQPDPRLGCCNLHAPTIPCGSARRCSYVCVPGDSGPS